MVLIAAVLLAGAPAPAALVQLEGMRLPEPRVRGSADVPYDRPADGDTPIVSLTTPDGTVLRGPRVAELAALVRALRA